jgi:hypothetical protein
MIEFSDTSGIFQHFEVNADPFWPKVSRLVGGSVVFHALVVATVIFVSPVRNALSIAMLFSEGNVVDRPYTKTEIGDESEITELTTEKFRYPEGYFAMDQMPFPTPTPTPPPQVAAAPYVPAPFPLQVDPLAVPSPGSSPLGAKNSTATPAATPSPDQEKAQRDLDDASRATGIDIPAEDEINKRPLKDWVAYATTLSKQNKLDLNQPFEVVIEGDLDRNGKLTNLKFTKRAGSVDVTDLGGKLIAALNDSGLLIYLKKLNQDNPGSHVAFTIKQSNDQVITAVESEASSVDSARQLAAGFKVMLAFGAKARAGKNEEVFLKSTTVNANEKKITFGLTLPRQTVVDLLKKEIASAESASPAP